MTFGAASGSNGTKGNGTHTGPNKKNTELAARQQKGAAQTSARKRRILGVRWSFRDVICFGWGAHAQDRIFCRTVVRI